MQASVSDITTLTIAISTFLILTFSGMVIHFLFLYQGKRFRHLKEMSELRETFNQTLLQSKLEIQEQTLDHISKELHANFSHLVSLININLSEILPQSSESVKENILETKSLAKQLMGELKALSASLNTDHIMKIGFTKALNNELGRLAKLKKYQINFLKTGEEFQLSPEHQIILFRLCQEILNNIVQYAKATVVTTNILFDDDELVLILEDNGIGFNPEITSQLSYEKESTGLLNIQKRARILGGEVYIESIESKGTKITINIPRLHK